MRSVIALIFLFCFSELFAQTPIFKNYGFEDGLPSSEVHCIFEDKLGYIWFATDRGMARYDGNKFIKFDTDNGLPENTILNIFEESDNRIWLCSGNNRLYFFNPLSEKIIFYSYPYNTILLKEILKEGAKKYIRNLEISDEGTFYFTFLTGLGYISITDQGKVQSFERSYGPDKNLLKSNILLRLNHYGKTCFPSTSFPNPGSDQSGGNFLIHSATDSFLINCNGYNFHYQIGVADYLFSGDTLFALVGKYLVKIESDSISYKELNSEGLCLLIAESGKILVGTFNGAIKLNQNLDIEATYLTNYCITKIIRDHEDGLWFSTLQQGVFYERNEIFKTYQFPKDDLPVFNHISFINNNIIFAGSNRTILILPRSLKGEYLKFPGSFFGSFFSSPNPNLDLFLGNKIKSTSSKSYVYSPFLSSDTVLINLTENNLGFISMDSIYGWQLDIDAVSDFIVVNDSLIYATTENGLFEIRNHRDVVTFVKAKIPQISYNAVEVKKDWILLASENAGIFCVKDSLFYNFNKQNGLLSNNIFDLVFANDSVCWISTSKGINKLTFTNNSQVVFEAITEQQGLISNEITCLAVKNDTVWVGTKKGLCFFNQNKFYQEKKVYDDYFYIDSVKLNNSLVAISKKNELVIEYDDKLDFYFTQVTYTDAKNVVYEYRISELDSKWLESYENHFALQSLHHGEYNLQIRAKFTSGIASIINQKIIVLKPFWLTWIFLFGVIVVLAVNVYVFYRIILRRSERKRNVAVEKIQLELKALIAQMNPHFTFNTINSIQHYIISKDKKEAVLYLSDFALLIRKTLEYSRRENITLKEELEFLLLYADLECKRFDFPFKVKIETVIISNEQEIELPALLIQPLLENAIIHGVGGLQSSSEIAIVVTETLGQLEITVADNGRGFDLIKSGEMRKSVGLDILRQRIKLYNGNQFHEDDLKFDQSYFKNTGTTVKVRLKNRT